MTIDDFETRYQELLALARALNKDARLASAGDAIARRRLPRRHEEFSSASLKFAAEALALAKVTFRN